MTLSCQIQPNFLKNREDRKWNLKRIMTFFIHLFLHLSLLSFAGNWTSPTQRPLHKMDKKYHGPGKALVVILEPQRLRDLMRPKGLKGGLRSFSWSAAPAATRWIHVFCQWRPKEKMCLKILFHTLTSSIHLVLTQKFHVSFEAAKISLNIRSLSEWMRTWLHVSLTKT